MNVQIRSCVQIAAAIVALTQVTHAAEFLWQHGAIRLGRLSVPAGFKVENYDYREGVVTTLRYKDGSRITLQSGDMYRLPLFRGDDYPLISSSDLDSKTVRTRRWANGQWCWREDNYKRQKTTGKQTSIYEVFPPNVGYSKVPVARRSEFDHALDSFVRESDKTR